MRCRRLLAPGEWQYGDPQPVYGGTVFEAELHWRDESSDPEWTPEEQQRKLYEFIFESRAHPLGSAEHTSGAIYPGGLLTDPDIDDDDDGGVRHVGGPFCDKPVDLSAWRNREMKVGDAKIQFTHYHTGHSHQFRGHFMELQSYWRKVGKRFGLH